MKKKRGKGKMMKFTVQNTKEFRGALTEFSRTFGSESIPIKITAGPDKVKFEGSNLEMCMTYFPDSEILSAGESCVHINHLLSLVKTIDNNSIIAFELSGNDTLDIVSDNTELSMGEVIASDQYPEITPVHNPSNVTVASKPFIRMCEMVEYAVLKDKFSNRFWHVEFTADGSNIKMVATNSYILPHVENNTASSSLRPEKIFISKNILKALSSMAKHCDHINLETYESNVFIKAGNLYVNFKKEENSAFPNYGKIMKQIGKNMATFESKDMLNILKKVCPLTKDINKSVKLKIFDNSIKFSAGMSNDSPNSMANFEIPSQYNGPEVNIGLNSKYLLDFIKTIKSGKVEFRFDSGDDLATLISEVDGCRITFKIMPVRID